VAQSRRGHYRAATYVRPTTVSRRVKKPATWVIVTLAILAIAAWNTLFGNDSGAPATTPHQTTPTAQVSPAR
jgi:hypothetical protein